MIQFVLLVACLLLAGPLLVVRDELHAVDVIIVIGGDHKPERMKRAVDLFRQGYAPIVLISAGTIVLEGDERLPEAEVMRRQALALGLPEAAIVLEKQSRSTFQNAYCSKILCRQLDVDQVLLVTSAYHSRRARRIFRQVFGSEIEVNVQPASQHLKVFWWLQPDQRSVVLYEYYSWGRYWLGVILRNEPGAGSAGSGHDY